MFYALSDDYSPFRVVQGPNATPVPINVPGSIMGLAFSADHTRMALTVMDGGQSKLWYGARDKLQPMTTAPLANHPVFGPMDKIAYVAGTPVQRIFIDGKAISPPGFMASAPVFCDTPQGLLVIYTVGVGAGNDIIATDSSGGGLKRLTQHEGANTYAACSPDGRLVAFFSTGKRKLGATSATSGHDDTGAGLFIMPIQRPWLAKKISNEVGESLRWGSAAARRGEVNYFVPLRRTAAASSEPVRSEISIRRFRTRASAPSLGAIGSNAPAPAAVNDAAGTPSETRVPHDRDRSARWSAPTCRLVALGLGRLVVDASHHEKATRRGQIEARSSTARAQFHQRALRRPGGARRVRHRRADLLPFTSITRWFPRVST